MQKTTVPKINIRMPANLKEWIETRSIRNFRSMNAEIVAVLTEVRDGEEHGLGMESFANPSGIPGVIELGSKAEDDYRKRGTA